VKRAVWQLTYLGFGLTLVSGMPAFSEPAQFDNPLEPVCIDSAVDSGDAREVDSLILSHNLDQKEAAATGLSHLSVSCEEDEPALSQLTSVDQLADVQPADWAYQALKSLIERYGIRFGYPDNLFRGNRALTRYEFAAALAETLVQIEPLLYNEQQFIQEDLVTLQRLQRDFAEALAALSNRVDDISERITQLEAERFSATTQMRAEFISSATNGNKANRTLVSRVRLNLLTRWRPDQSLLTTQLEMGSGGGDAVSEIQNEGDNLLGSNGLLAGAGGYEYVEIDPTVKLRRLYYTFEPLPNLAVSVGAKMSPSDFIDRNRFANNEAVDFNSSFFINNPLIIQNQIDREGGAGVAVNWKFKNTPFALNALYIAADSADPQAGFFSDRDQASVELEYIPQPALALRLQYTNATIDSTQIDAFGVNAAWAYNTYLGVFGRLGFAHYTGFNTALDRTLDTTPWTWSVGFSVRNFPIPGNRGGIAIGQPFITPEVGDSTQTNIEAFYNVVLSDNLSMTPNLLVVTNADNEGDSQTIWQFGWRTVFSF
jgi:hypothetical protein